MQSHIRKACTCLAYPTSTRGISPGCQSKLEFPILFHASDLTPSLPPPLLISLVFYNCYLPLHLFAAVWTLASSNFLSVSTKQKVIVLSRILILPSWVQCLFTLEMVQQSVLWNLFCKSVSSTSKNLTSSYLVCCVCMCVCVCVLCVFVLVLVCVSGLCVCVCVCVCVC